MATFKNSTRCHPFSSQPLQGCLVCCNKMNLVSALDHTFKCLMCLMRKNAPTGVHLYSHLTIVPMNILLIITFWFV